MPGDLSRFTSIAQLLRQLRAIPPGQSFRVSLHMLDIEVPADPLDRQTPEFLVEFLRARLPFYCTATPGPERMWPKWWDFHRPAAVGGAVTSHMSKTGISTP